MGNVCVANASFVKYENRVFPPVQTCVTHDIRFLSVSSFQCKICGQSFPRGAGDHRYIICFCFSCNADVCLAHAVNFLFPNPQQQQQEAERGRFIITGAVSRPQTVFRCCNRTHNNNNQVQPNSPSMVVLKHMAEKWDCDRCTKQ